MPDAAVAPIVIIGGGIAGLAAAYELQRRGVSFVLLEGSSRFGGLILTEEIDGFTLDGGADALLIQKPAALTLCRDLGIENRLVSTKTPRTAFILRCGELVPLPETSVLGIPTRIGPLVTTRLFSPAGKIRMAMELAIPRRRIAASDEVDESIGSFIGRRFGREAVDYLAEPLLAGIHSGDVDRLSMRALFPRLVDAEQRYGSVIRAFRKLRQAAPSGGVFRSLPGGIGELVDTIVRKLPRESLRLNTPVDVIEYRAPSASAGLWRVRLASHQSPASHQSIDASDVILAVPAYVVARLVRGFDSALARLADEVPYVSTGTIALAYPRSAVHHSLLGSGFVVPRVGSDLRITAASWVSSKWPDRAPAGQVLLRAFVGGARDPGILDLEDAELRNVAHRDLAGILKIDSPPRLVRVFRWDRAGAQHEVGHLRRMASIADRLRAWPGLHVTGSGFRGTGIPDCVADARATAASIAASSTGR